MHCDLTRSIVLSFESYTKTIAGTTMQRVMNKVSEKLIFYYEEIYFINVKKSKFVPGLN
jgi:hypothetical protein